MRRGFDLPGLPELRRIGELLVVLAARDLRVRYKQSMLGVLWSVIQPVSLMVVFVLILGPGMGTSMPGGEPYSLFVLAGLVPWGFFSSTLTQSANCLVANRNLVTKVYFPREAFPFACVATALVDFAIGLATLVVMLLYSAIRAEWAISLSLSALFLPGIILVQVLFSAGLGMLLAMGNLFHRDVRPILTVALNLGMFVSAVVVPTPSAPGWLSVALSFNPMVHIITAYRECLLHGRLPGSFEFGYAVVIAMIVFAASWLVFRRASDRFAECI